MITKVLKNITNLYIEIKKYFLATIKQLVSENNILSFSVVFVLYNFLEVCAIEMLCVLFL